MKKKKILLFAIILIGVISIFCCKSYATNSVLPTAENNIKIYLQCYSSLVPLSSGYMRVFYDSINNNIGVENYDDNFRILSKRKIDLELSIYGGFYAGNDAYYIVEGQNNKQEDSNLEVIRVIKYDKEWKRLGAAKITSDSKDSYKKIRYPFDAGTVEMTEVDGKLYIVTGHEGYVDSAVGQGHQGLLMIEVDESTLTGRIVNANLWHSFAQYIDYKDSNLYLLEQSEGSRCTSLAKFDKTTLNRKTISVLPYGGNRTSTWAVPCYASVNGMAISSSNILGIGTSIDQSKYDEARSSSLPHNIYLTLTPINNFAEEATTVKWITNYTDKSHSFTGLEITKVNDNRFLVTWEEFGASQDMIDNDTLSTNILHYVFIDGNGNKLGSEYTAPASISDCKPIVKGSKIVYYASNENMVDFYTIDANTGKFNKVMYRIAGENATWTLDNGTLTISGNGEMFVDTKVKFRGELSSTRGSYSYSSADNAWKPIRNLVNEIIVKEGITDIPDEQFKYFSNITQVILPNSMKTIGKSAFQDCENLRKVIILSNVTSIGEDALWSGYYWIGSNTKVCYATIYTTKESYSEKWAKENKVSCKYLDNLTLTDNATETVLKVLGEATTNLVVNRLEKDNKEYTDMKAKVSDKSILFAYNISTNNGISAGNNELTFKTRNAYKGKNITIVQKKSNGDIEVNNKTVDNNGNIQITTNELSSFMLAINPSDVVSLLGDVDGNDKITTKDAKMILQHIVKKITLTPEENKVADVDGNQKITTKDAKLILQHIVKKITKFPVEK